MFVSANKRFSPRLAAPISIHAGFRAAAALVKMRSQKQLGHNLSLKVLKIEIINI